MTRRLPSLAAAVLLATACQKGGAGEHAHPAPPPAEPAHPAPAPAAPAPLAAAPAPANPVQREMRLLTAAIQSGVHGLGTGDVRGIALALHEVHGAKQATAAALKDGSYKPPKNGDQLARFVELDEAFHQLLYPLVKASQANDLPATATALGAVVNGCHACHQEFREGFTPPPAAPKAP